MKKKHVRKYLRRADDCMEEIERKIGCMEAAILFLSMGMERFHQGEDCMEAKTVGFVRDYLKAMKTGEIASLHEALDRLKEV